MSFPFNITNPGIYLSGLLTSEEQAYVTNLVGLTYVEGDILYHNGTDMINLGVGTVGQSLVSDGSIPGWSTPAGGGDVVGPTGAIDSNLASYDGTTGKLIKDSLVPKSMLTTTIGFFNGTFSEKFDALVTSDGTTITMSLQSSVGGDLTKRFSSGQTTLDCTPAQTIALTAGTDTSPQSNYIYILESTGNVTKSTTGWATTEHIKVAYFYVQSALTVQTYGALVNQNWNDGTVDDVGQGHLSHIGGNIRRQGADWFSGVTGAGTSEYLTPYAGGATFHVNAGVISQMHLHNYTAKDTSLTDVAFCANYPSDSYREVTDMNDMLVDAAGASLTGRYFNILLGGVANKGGEYSPLMIKLPNGSYNNSQNAIDDVDRYDDISMPREFNKESGTGFFIARITIRNQSDTTFTVMATENLLVGNGGSGGAVGSAITDFSDNQITVFNNLDSTKIMNFDVSGVTAGNTRTMSTPDQDGTLALLEAANAFTVGGQSITVADTTNQVGLTINQNEATNDNNALEIILPAGTGNGISVQQSGSAFGAGLEIVHSGYIPNIELYRNETTTAVAGEIRWFSNDSGSNKTEIATIEAALTTGTDTAEVSRMYMKTYLSGAQGIMLDLGNGINGISVGHSTEAGIVESGGNQDLTLQTGNATTGSITITDGIDGDITLVANGNGNVNAEAGQLFVGTGSDNGQIRSRGNFDLFMSTGNLTSSYIQITDGADGDITLAPNGDGDVLASGCNLEVLGGNIRIGANWSIASSTDGEYITFGDAGASAVNGFRISNAITTNAPAFAAQGGDTNIDIELTPKGTGVVTANGNEVDVIPETTSEASNATPAPTGGSRRNKHYITALAANATVGAPSGTVANGNQLTMRIKDNGTARTLAWNAIFAGMADSLPTTTTISKVMYLGFEYDSTNVKWNLIALNEQA